MPHNPPQPIVQIACWQFDANARELSDGLRSRRLAPKAAAVLAMLAEADGQVVSRHELLDRVWPGAEVSDEVLTQSIAELRRAMGDVTARHIIATVHGSGYRLGVPVRADAVDGPLRAPGFDSGFDLDAYLDAREARRLCEQDGERALERAVALCATAVARAPRSVPVLSEFAVLAAMRRLYMDDGGQCLDAALNAAETATSLRPDLACGYVARGVVLAALGNRSGACAAFDRAIMRDPEDFQAHYHYARAQFAFGASVRAARLAECAARLRADDYRPLYLAAASWSGLGETQRMHAAATTGLARLHSQICRGGGDRARSALRLFLALSGQGASAHPAAGMSDTKRHGLLYYDVAAFAALGEVDDALDRLERLVDHGFRDWNWLRADPTLAPLRNSPRYRHLVLAVGSA